MIQVAARLQTASFMANLAGTDVHPAESYVLHELWKQSPLSHSDISQRLGIGNAAIGKTLLRLERNGFVKRGRMGSDGRRVMVRLTDKGYRAHDQFEEAALALIDEINEVVGTREAKRFTTQLHKLASHFSAKQNIKTG